MGTYRVTLPRHPCPLRFYSASSTRPTTCFPRAVKQVIEAHGWEIRVTEGTDGGARFEITGIEFEQ